MRDLDNIVNEEVTLTQQKQTQYDDLFQKYNTLNSPVSSVAVSYSLDLDYEEQIKYAKIGMFHYWADLNRKSTLYKDKNEWIYNNYRCKFTYRFCRRLFDKGYYSINNRRQKDYKWQPPSLKKEA